MLGFDIIREVFRQERNSHKLDLALNGTYMIELFSFPSPPPRVSSPEATGMRHLAFEVHQISEIVEELVRKEIFVEPVRIDEHTGKRFTFIADPDGLPIEFYEK